MVVISMDVNNIDDVRVVSIVDVDFEIEEERVNVRVLSSVVVVLCVVDLVTSEEDNADAVTASGSDKVSPEWSSLKIKEAVVLSSSSKVGP